MKNVEVEVRAIIDEARAQRIETELSDKFAKKLSTIIDVYFCHANVKDFSDIEMNEVGSYSLRLRRSRGAVGQVDSINTKTIRNFGDHGAWYENEARISDAEEVFSILATIGQKPYIRIKKERTSFDCGEISFEIERIEEFGVAVECEMVVADGEESKAKKKVTQFLVELGLKEEEFVSKSVSNMIMRKLSFSQKILSMND